MRGLGMVVGCASLVTIVVMSTLGVVGVIKKPPTAWPYNLLVLLSWIGLWAAGAMFRTP